MVPGAGIEPAQSNAPRDFKSLASTNSAIPARDFRILVAYPEKREKKTKKPSQKRTEHKLFVNTGGGTQSRTGDDDFADRCLSHLAMPPPEVDNNVH